MEDQTGNAARTCSVTEQARPGLICVTEQACLGVICGGTIEIKGAVNSLEYLELAIFAVDEHNKKQNTLLEFVKIVKVKEQLVAGMNYHINLEATDGGHKKIFEAIIWEQLWMNCRELYGFKLIDDA